MGSPINIVVHGASGRMGQEVLAATSREPSMKVVGAVDLKATEDRISLPPGLKAVPFSSDLETILTTSSPDVLIDFTNAQATMNAVPVAVQHGVNLVIGTTGLSDQDLNLIDQLSRSHNVGAVVAPNFSLGAVLMIHLAKIAAGFFDYAEIIEMHHHGKADAPSGTAISTARAMMEAKGKPFSHSSVQKETLSGSRGAYLGGIALHSIRLPGLLAHQEVILGLMGQTLTIRHDSISRECYMPGVLLAVREVIKLKGLVYGLSPLLHLENKI